MLLMDWLYGVLASLGLWQKEAKILLLSPDWFDRLTFFHMLEDERLVQHQPTEDPTSGEFSIGKIKFKVFDLGYRNIALRVLRDYNAKVDAVVYLVNPGNYRGDDYEYGSADWIIYESRKELRALLSDDALANVPFLILGMGFCFLEDVLCHKLGLTNLTTGKGEVNLANNVRPLEVFVCRTRMDYEDGFKWLSRYIK